MDEPRSHEEIQREYFQICAEVGEREFRITMMRDEIKERHQRMQQLAREIAEVNQKAEDEKSQG